MISLFAINETSNPIDFDNLIIADKTSIVLEINDYYPFGLKWYSNGTNLNKYKFGGKELQTELNLNTYDFHARQQDPQLGRFWGVDPMAEKFSSNNPFNYTLNNPVLFIDPTGMSTSPIYDLKSGDFLGTDNEGYKGEVLFMSSSEFQLLGGDKNIKHSDAMKFGTKVS